MSDINQEHFYWDFYEDTNLLPEFRGNLTSIINLGRKEGYEQSEQPFQYISKNDLLRMAVNFAVNKKQSGLIYRGINQIAIEIITELTQTKYIGKSIEEIRQQVSKDIAVRLFGWKFEAKKEVI